MPASHLQVRVPLNGEWKVAASVDSRLLAVNAAVHCFVAVFCDWEAELRDLSKPNSKWHWHTQRQAIAQMIETAPVPDSAAYHASAQRSSELKRAGEEGAIADRTAAPIPDGRRRSCARMVRRQSGAASGSSRQSALDGSAPVSVSSPTHDSKHAVVASLRDVGVMKRELTRLRDLAGY